MATSKAAYREEPTSFIKGKHDLDKLLKSLSKATEGAVEFLIKVMDDEKIDNKIRIECASKLISFQMEAVKDINSDSIQRLVAEIKMNKPTTLVPTNSVPRVDFSTIRSV